MTFRSSCSIKDVTAGYKWGPEKAVSAEELSRPGRSVSMLAGWWRGRGSSLLIEGERLTPNVASAVSQTEPRTV